MDRQFPLDKWCPVGKVRQTFAQHRRVLCLGSIFALLLLAAAPAAFSQSCALCYTQAASSGAKMIQALKSGILVLIIPPTLGTVGMIFVVRRKNKQVRHIDEGVESGQDW